MNNNKNTAEIILDTAQSIVQDAGFNGFSYAHIAEKVGIRTASIHYHFPNKEDLGEALIARYHRHFISAIAQIDTETQNNLEKLRKFTLLYGGPVQDYCTCLGVMLSTDLATLSGKTREGLAQLFTANLEWLERVMEQGRREEHLNFKGAADVQAHQFLASLQGAQLLARSFRDLAKFNMIAEGLLSALT
ncbi:TetR/AcrR family transcriptional regulator [Paenibacillus sp. V4I7]|uniref:TetR/AcrR family transcriptional regulator n=1 Tax=Paenibacillus sp. V4I7 TaxID=3042307 RepID=UPI00278B2D60|nr:TetR/AcrR family transcriptional regulator [Paenibacillus sp. V4I7]MDQ0899071.1 TetR/AcrR family transcriptional repressor of nem operon [Paenibacillus sp. V4I7]